MKKVTLLFILMFIICIVNGQEIPQKISYQAKLLENGEPVTGTKSITFTIGTWSETQSVDIDGGIYSVTLGVTTPIPTSIFDETSSIELEISVEGTSLSPQTEILSVPYAYKAQMAVEAENVFSGDYNDLINIPTDNDTDTTNELQTLSISDSDLTISDGNTVTLPTGSSYTAGNGISISSNEISMSGTYTGDFNVTGEIDAYGNLIDAGSGSVRTKELYSTASYLGIYSERSAFIDIDHDNNGDESFSITSDNENNTLLRITENYNGEERITLLGGSYYGSYPIYLTEDTRINGNLSVSGSVSKGSGSFKIDHPLDPESMYLYHSFVESPDMMNIYNGNVELDFNGEAIVELPDYFEALNMEFRYQLTCIGGFAQVYIAEEINNNSFKIAGGTNGLKVSWQVTGIRQDPFANENRIQVEVKKSDEEKGHYLHYEEYKQPLEKSIEYVKESKKEE